MDSPERGRPGVPDDTRLAEQLMVRLTVADMDLLYRLARLRRSSAAAIARDLIRRELSDCPEFKA